jgi:hypothetical protein
LTPLTRLGQLDRLQLLTPGVTDGGLKILAETSCTRLSIIEADVSFRGLLNAYGARSRFVFLSNDAMILSSHTLLSTTIIGGSEKRGPVATRVFVAKPVQDDELELLAHFPCLIGASLSGSPDWHAKHVEAALEHLQQQPDLEELTLSGPLDTEALAAIGKLSGLRRLAIRRGLPNEPSVLRPLGQLRHLEHLGLRATGINDSHLEFLQQLTELRTLDLGENPIVGPGLKHIAELSKLESLWLIDCGRFSDGGMEHLRALDNLQQLILQFTQVTDAGLRPLYALPRLRDANTLGSCVTHGGKTKLDRWLNRERPSPTTPKP